MTQLVTEQAGFSRMRLNSQIFRIKEATGRVWLGLLRLGRIYVEHGYGLRLREGVGGLPGATGGKTQKHESYKSIFSSHDDKVG